MPIKKTATCTWVCRCRIKLSVLANDPDLHLLPNRIKCWSRSHCRYYLARNDKALAGSIVRAMDIYKTMVSLGSESERLCSPADIKKHLLGKKVTGVALEMASDKNRSFITTLTVEGGTTIYLAPSTKGVTIYKVTHE